MSQFSKSWAGGWLLANLRTTRRPLPTACMRWNNYVWAVWKPSSSVSTVPEPASIVLLASGLSLVAGFRFRVRRRGRQRDAWWVSTGILE
jgi:hypothetical protein